MARYIDADKLLEYYEERHKNLCLKNGETDAYCQGYEDAMYAAEHLDFAADVVPRAELAVRSFQDAATIDDLQKKLVVATEVLKYIFSDLKKKIHDKAVYPNCHGVEPYVSLKAFDAILQNYLNNSK